MRAFSFLQGKKFPPVLNSRFALVVPGRAACACLMSSRYIQFLLFSLDELIYSLCCQLLASAGESQSILGVGICIPHPSELWPSIEGCSTAPEGHTKKWCPSALPWRQPGPSRSGCIPHPHRLVPDVLVFVGLKNQQRQAVQRSG